MPYPHHGPIKPAPLKTPYLPLDDKEKLQATLERVKKERDAWKDKAQVLEMENEELQRQLKEQSGEDRAGKRPRVQEDLFSLGTTDYSQIPQSSGARKGLGLFQHDHQIYGTCSINSRGCRKIQDDLQGVLDQGLIQISRQVSSPESQEQEVNIIIPYFNISEKVEIAYHPREPVVICPPGPMPYTSDNAVPYRYAATIIENGKEVEIKTLASVTNIAANSRMTRSGRVFAPPVIPSRNVEKDPVVVVPVTREAEGQTRNSTLYKETDELLRIIKLSDYKVEGSAMSPAEDEKEDLISLSRSNTEVSIPQRVKKVDIQKLQGISCCSLSIQ
ncbi:hypothetical protein KIW84_032127 [Lathyrus oleraceus]|uniref:Uncharacterized protein n=1 Tax=Pisum sativum TaxID=3888 RepID=A0A9D4XT27_PEA|nr:hypothetical protein KIW84_032127 [Pisum sativum]